MKSIALLLFLMMSANYLSSQKWNAIFGDPYISEYGVDVFESYDCGYLIMAQIDHKKSWLIKTDINGVMLWDKLVYDVEPSYTLFNTVVSDSDGSIYLLGNRNLQSVYMWPAIMKLDSCGEKVWCFEYEDTEFEFGGGFLDAIVLEDGNILAVAQMESQEQIDEIFLYCINVNGELLWRKSYASKNQYPLFAARVGKYLHHFNDHYIISGNGYYAYPNNPTHVYLHPLFILIDSLFNEKCVIPFGMADSLTGKTYDVIPINDTLFMGVGEFLHPPAYYNNDPDVVFNGLQMFFDTNCTECGFNVITNAMVDTNIKGNLLTGIERINDSLFIMNSFYGDTYEGGPPGDYIMDTSGYIFKKQYYELVHGNPECIKTFDGKYVTIMFIYENGSTTKKDVYMYKLNDSLNSDTIYPGQYKYDSLCSYPIPSDTIDVTDCILTTRVVDPPLPNEYLKDHHKLDFSLYPNPSEYYIILNIKNLQGYPDCIFEIFSSTGITVFKGDVLSNEINYINTSNFAQGIYMLCIQHKGEIIGREKFIKR